MADAYLSTYNPDPNNATPAVQAALNYLKNMPPPRRLFVEPPPAPYSGYRLDNSGVVEESAPVGIKGLRVAVKVDFGDLEILGTDPANPPLFYTDDTFEFEANNPDKPGNSTILFLFYAPSAGPAHSQFKLSHLRFRGPHLPDASKFPPGNASYGLVVFFGKAWNQRLSNITVQYCTFTDPVRYAIDFEHVSQVTVSTCSFQMFSSYAYNDLFPDTIHPAIIVALFSAQHGIVNATVSGCVFNGRVKALSGYNPAVNYTTRWGADGFVFFQKGGGINLTSNTIRNYYLEGVQTNAGPSYVNYNTFETPFSTGVAYMAYADTNNIMPGATPYILQRLYHFKHNTVNGGSVGVKFAGNSYPASGLAPQLTCEVTDNSSIRLNPLDKIPSDTFTLGIFASSAESLLVRNNQFHQCGMMLKTGIDVQAAYPNVDFNCLNMTIEDNVVHAFNGSRHGIFFQNPLRSGGIATIGKNTLVRGNVNYNHIRLGGTNMPKVSGQIGYNITYKVYTPLPPAGNPALDTILYNGGYYKHTQQFTGVIYLPTFGIYYGHPQVRFATAAPWSYTVKIGTSQANKNTYKIGTSEEAAFNRFSYYDPSSDSAMEVEATPPNSPKDGVTVQDY